MEPISVKDRRRILIGVSIDIIKVILDMSYMGRLFHRFG